MTKLTITLPVYNGMPFVKEAVESVLRQTYSDFRFLVIDDGSTDGSAAYLRSIDDPRIRVIVRENRGLGTTLNQLFSESETEYVARMDSDDVCSPDRIKTMMAFLEDNSDVVMAGCDQAFLVGSKTMNAAPRPTDHESIRQQLLIKRPGILHPTIVVRREAWERVGGYRLGGAGEDLDFCLRMCDVGRVANVPALLYFYRLHGVSLSSSCRHEVNFGYDYGVACAMARERGEAEPDLKAFRKKWESRSIAARTATQLGDLGQYLYRSSLVRRLEGRRFSSAVLMLGAAAAQPNTAADHVLKSASRFFRQRQDKILLSSPAVVRNPKFD